MSHEISEPCPSPYSFVMSERVAASQGPSSPKCAIWWISLVFIIAESAVVLILRKSILPLLAIINLDVMLLRNRFDFGWMAAFTASMTSWLA